MRMTPVRRTSIVLALWRSCKPRCGATVESHQQSPGKLAWVQQLPGVTSTGVVQHLPLGLSQGRVGIRVPGLDRAPGEEPIVQYNVVAGQYFESLRIALVNGRDFSDAEAWDGTSPVVVVNQALARRYVQGQPIGQALWLSDRSEPLRIVGVVADVRERVPIVVHIGPEAQAEWLAAPRDQDAADGPATGKCIHPPPGRLKRHVVKVADDEAVPHVEIGWPPIHIHRAREPLAGQSALEPRRGTRTEVDERRHLCGRRAGPCRGIVVAGTRERVDRGQVEAPCEAVAADDL